eukprot:6252854-Prymnesium_polylepis.1
MATRLNLTEEVTLRRWVDASPRPMWGGPTQRALTAEGVWGVAHPARPHSWRVGGGAPSTPSQLRGGGAPNTPVA